MNKNMSERINWYKKEYVFEQYTRIVPNFKNYERISKKKMLEEIYKVYSYENIIDICTVRELKYLELILKKSKNKDELLSDKYEWERETLKDKFLIEREVNDLFIPSEIIGNVKEAIKKVNWDTAKKLDAINEILVSYCKIQGSALLYSVISLFSSLTHIDEDLLRTHMYYNKVFNYYVYIYSVESHLSENLEIAVYQDYYDIEDELEEERKKQGLASSIPIDFKMFKTLFYNDFDINNIKIKKFLDEIKKLPFFWHEALKEARIYALLNIDREPLKEAIKNVPNLKNYDLSELFEIMDEAMDEMPSGALNGFTPNQAKKIEIESKEMEREREEKYIKQQNACLSKKEANLFYKIYFALLEFTNNKYKIKKSFKIYKRTGLNPNELTDIIDCFWKNKDKIILEFCTTNPYKFNEEELDIASEFKKGFRDLIIIVKFEEEYTGLVSKDRVYMIKGINDNLDNIISYKDLPLPVITSIIPFKNVLIYDSIFVTLSLKFGNDFIKIVEEDYKNSMKYYHL